MHSRRAAIGGRTHRAWCHAAIARGSKPRVRAKVRLECTHRAGSHAAIARCFGEVEFKHARRRLHLSQALVPTSTLGVLCHAL